MKHGFRSTWIPLLALILLCAVPTVYAIADARISGHSRHGKDVSRSGLAASDDLLSAQYSMLQDFIGLLMLNPQIYPLEPAGGQPNLSDITRLILKLLVPLYEILILLTGIYIIYVALIPQKRAYAKEYLTNLIVSLVLVSLSPMIFQLILDIELSLVTEIFAQTQLTPAQMNNLIVIAMVSFLAYPYNCCLGWIAVLNIILALLCIWIRYFGVQVFGAAFPAILFLYMFNYTKKLGVKLIKFSLMWIFVPVIMSLFLVICLTSLNDLTLLQGGILAIGSFFMIGISPLIMTQTMSIIGGLVVAAGGRRGSWALTAAGHMMMGGGPSALEAAGGQIGYMKAGFDEHDHQWRGVKATDQTPGTGGMTGGGVMGAIREGISGAKAGGVAGFFGGVFQGGLFGAPAAGGGSGGGGGGGAGDGGLADKYRSAKGFGKVWYGGLAVVGAPIDHVAKAAGLFLGGVSPEKTDVWTAGVGGNIRSASDMLIDRKKSFLKSFGASIRDHPIKTAIWTGIGISLLSPASPLALVYGASVGVWLASRNWSKAGGRSLLGSPLMWTGEKLEALEKGALGVSGKGSGGGGGGGASAEEAKRKEAKYAQKYLDNYAVHDVFSGQAVAEEKMSEVGTRFREHHKMVRDSLDALDESSIKHMVPMLGLRDRQEDATDPTTGARCTTAIGSDTYQDLKAKANDTTRTYTDEQKRQVKATEIYDPRLLAMLGKQYDPTNVEQIAFLDASKIKVGDLMNYEKTATKNIRRADQRNALQDPHIADKTAIATVESRRNIAVNERRRLVKKRSKHLTGSKKHNKLTAQINDKVAEVKALGQHRELMLDEGPKVGALKGVDTTKTPTGDTAETILRENGAESVAQLLDIDTNPKKAGQKLNLMTKLNTTIGGVSVDNYSQLIKDAQHISTEKGAHHRALDIDRDIRNEEWPEREYGFRKLKREFGIEHLT